jgi:hypothetical protein
MIAERLWLITQRLVAVRLPSPALSNVWWPYRLKEPNDAAEKALVLWLNSTLGIMTFFGHRVPTRGPWVDFKKPSLGALHVLNVLALEEGQLAMLAALYDRVSGESLGTLQQMETDETRVAIDIGISRVLQIPDLTPLRALLGQEPIICGASLGRQVAPDEKEAAQLEFELIT